MSEKDDCALGAVPEREKWEADVRLREQELRLKERQFEVSKVEAEAKMREVQRARWANPLALAIVAAALAAGGNAWVAFINGQNEAGKGRGELQLAAQKAESDRVLEVIRGADADKVAANLRFLLDAGLVADPERRRSIDAYLQNRRAGEGAALPTGPGYAAQIIDPSDNTTTSVYFVRCKFDKIVDLLVARTFYRDQLVKNGLKARLSGANAVALWGFSDWFDASATFIPINAGAFHIRFRGILDGDWRDGHNFTMSITEKWMGEGGYDCTEEKLPPANVEISP